VARTFRTGRCARAAAVRSRRSALEIELHLRRLLGWREADRAPVGDAVAALEAIDRVAHGLRHVARQVAAVLEQLAVTRQKLGPVPVEHGHEVIACPGS